MNLLTKLEIKLSALTDATWLGPQTLRNKVFALYRIYHFWRQLFPKVCFIRMTFFDIFVGYRLFPIAKYPLITYRMWNWDIFPVCRHSEIHYFGIIYFDEANVRFFWHTSLRQYVTSPEAPLLFSFRKGVTRRITDLTNASVGQMCHLANASQCCLVFILSIWFFKNWNLIWASRQLRNSVKMLLNSMKKICFTKKFFTWKNLRKSFKNCSFVQ